MTKRDAKRLEIAAVGCANHKVAQLAATYFNAPAFSALHRLSGELDAIVRESPLWSTLMAEVTDQQVAEFAERNA